MYHTWDPCHGGEGRGPRPAIGRQSFGGPHHNSSGKQLTNSKKYLNTFYAMCAAGDFQISQNDNVELVERMDESPDGVTASSSVKLELSAVSPARQKSPAHLLTRTNASVSNCVVSSPTKMILDPSVSTFQSVVCAKSASGTSQAPVNSSTLSCINNSFAMSKKRLKVSESLEKVTACDDISGLRRRILEHKLARLKSIRERYYIFFIICTASVYFIFLILL